MSATTPLARAAALFCCLILGVLTATPAPLLAAQGERHPFDQPPALPQGALAAGPAISANWLHTCALTPEGGVRCWGSNQFGQLGDGTTDSRLTPVNVRNLTRGVTAVSGGRNHTCALTTGGGVQCWGGNEFGQLGDGTTETRLVPVDVMGLTSGVQAISSGYEHTCALTTGGGVKCWGSNEDGQLGDGTTEDRLSPTDVNGLTSGMAAVSAGEVHTCALTTGGGVRCWGSNADGQLGDGTTIDRLSPVDVSGLAGGVTAVDLGAVHTCALTTGGGVKCWGANWNGQLGDGATTDRLTPVDVSGLTSGVGAISAGSFHTCAVTTGRGLKCWGDNWLGQLGDGATTDRLTPVDVKGLTSGVAAVSGGGGHTCALTAAGGIKCWGLNEDGQLGDGTQGRTLTPTAVTGLNSGVTAISSGYAHTCALAPGGSVNCWGSNEVGQLGDGTLDSRWVPSAVDGLTSGVAAVAAGGEHTCALTTGGGVKCWGGNRLGQLGDGTTQDRQAPVNVIGLTSGVKAIAAGGNHTCALTTIGGVKCWGNNLGGQLGDGTTETRLSPVAVVGLTSGIGAIIVGDGHTCALTAGGGVKCWGRNTSGPVGDGTTEDRLSPVDVVGLTSGVQAIAGGYSSTCALTTGAPTKGVPTTGVPTKGFGVKCWGNNSDGQLGDGTTQNRLTPVDVKGLTSGIKTITGGGSHTCALTTGVEALCWGDNEYGQLGDGTTETRLSPVGVKTLAGGETISAGEYHTCAITTGGLTTGVGAQCWGLNQSGQLGINQGWSPVDVLFHRLLLPLIQG
jgi:alpha-tubulin suppressor-like RCC1 family protein